MKEINVKGTARAAFGKKAAHEIRKANAVPCNLYGEAKDENGAPVALPFTVTNDELRNLIYSPDIYAVNLNIDGKECKAILKEIQFHPVKDNVLHVDFYEITDTKPIVMEVPIKLNGLAEGVKAGGRLAASVRKLKVKALPKDMPDEVVLDVTSLGVGKSIKVQDIHVEGVEILNAKSVVVAQVKLTRAARAAQNAQ